MKLNKNIPVLLLILSILTGCALPGAAATPTVDPNSILTSIAATVFVNMTEQVANASPTPSPTPTETPVPAPTEAIQPTSIPTIEPIPGVMRANANVRSVPAKSKTKDIGGLFFGNAVKVIGRNDAGTWLYIIYADSPTGTGWVTASAVTLSKEMGLLPVLLYPNGEDAAAIMYPPFIFTITGTPLPPSTPPADWSKYGTLTQPANVRIGPSVGFLTIGVLNPGQKVTFRGRIADNVWVQIDYPSGPDGHGWILASLVQANDGYGGLPFYDVMGTPVTPGADSPSATPGAGGVEATSEPNTTPAAAETATVSSPAAAGAEAEVTTQINVRSGPAQTYNPYGMLNPKDKVVITGVTLNKYWYQIQYSGSTSGFGWVASQYVRVIGDMSNIPSFNNEGTPAP
jgi:uncharacterized protein YraI